MIEEQDLLALLIDKIEYQIITNKDKLISVSIALSTVLILFLLAATFRTQNVGTSIQTTAKTSKMLPIYNVDTEENKVALTINCAWNADDIDLILETLTKNQVKVTFFNKNADSCK